MKTYDVGDVVRIRQWDEMAAECDETHDGIRTPAFFPRVAKWLCGALVEIKAIVHVGPCDDVTGVWYYGDFLDNGGPVGITMDYKMLEPVSEKYCGGEFSEADFLSLLK